MLNNSIMKKIDKAILAHERTAEGKQEYKINVTFETLITCDITNEIITITLKETTSGEELERITQTEDNSIITINRAIRTAQELKDYYNMQVVYKCIDYTADPISGKITECKTMTVSTSNNKEEKELIKILTILERRYQTKKHLLAEIKRTLKAIETDRSNKAHYIRLEALNILLVDRASEQ